MTEHTPEANQFFLTAPTPCPYLEGREERKLFTHLSGRRASVLHSVLSDHGFRRSQNLIYRPACDGCSACRSVRIVADGFFANRRQRRVMRKNADILSAGMPARATTEQYDLFVRYLQSRHAGGGMTQMTFADYEYMIEDTPVDTQVIEYRLDGELIAVALTDLMPDGVSMVYSFFDPEHHSRGLGNYMILDHIRSARVTGMPYVYLGYWVKDSEKMAYKADYAPMQVQTGSVGWQAFEPDGFE